MNTLLVFLMPRMALDEMREREHVWFSAIINTTSVQVSGVSLDIVKSNHIQFRRTAKHLLGFKWIAGHFVLVISWAPLASAVKLTVTFNREVVHVFTVEFNQVKSAEVIIQQILIG